jgi:hypothetical protein
MTTDTGRRRVSGLAAAGLAGLFALALAGCAAGSAARTGPTAADPAHSATPPAAATPGGIAPGRTHFTDYSVDGDGPTSAVIVTGAVGDYGHGVFVYPDGKTDPEHTGELELRLRHGTFRLQAAALDRAIAAAFGHWPGSPRTCSGHITVSATVPVLGGSGTGAYRGITGALAASATIDEVDRPGPGCQTATGAFLSQVIVITGTGTVTVRT